MCEGLHRGSPVFCQLGLIAPTLQQHQCDFLIYRIILNQENRQAGPGFARHRIKGLAALSIIGNSLALTHDYLDRQGEMETAALPRLTFHP